MFAGTNDKECEMLNERYHKNQTLSEVKAHHSILSFDPKDPINHGLTGRKAQALGSEFARKFFAGHQTLVCTHMDGHNDSDNIHVHMILNSLRKFDVDKQDSFCRSVLREQIGSVRNLCNQIKQKHIGIWI